MVKISAPGKMFISGEWSILEPGNQGVTAAVNKRVYVDSIPSDGKYVSVDDFGIKNIQAVYDGNISWQTKNQDHKEKLKFTKAAIETTLRYLGEDVDFNFRSWGEDTQLEVDGKMKKLGFGSSGASVVAFISSVLNLKGYDISERKTRDLIYKLSMLAHYNAQGKVGSGYDVAASVYGGMFVYQSTPSWLMSELGSGRDFNELVDSKWKGFVIEPLEVPDDFNLLIGWTRQSASTSDMVKQLSVWKTYNIGDYQKLILSVSNIASEAIEAYREGRREEFLEALRENERRLALLGQKSGVNIETEDLRKLSELANECGAAGKLSGAGGGDCGIAVCYDKETAEKVKQKWTENGIFVIDATIDREGVRLE